MVDDKKKRAQIYEDLYDIDQMGQESDTLGAKAVNHVFKREQQKRLKKKLDLLNLLDLRRSYNDYNKLCAKVLSHFLREEDLGGGVLWEVKPDVVGVRMRLKVKGRLFERAFRTVRQPVYDLTACQEFAVSASALVTKLMKKQEEGRVLVARH